MNTEIENLAWPIARLGEGLAELARRSGLQATDTETPRFPDDLTQTDRELDIWITWAGNRLGVEAEAVECSVSDFGQLMSNAGPALFHRHDENGKRFWLVIKSKSRRLQLVGPDLRISHCDAELLCSAVCASYERPIADEIDRLLDAAGLEGHRRSKARTALLRERLAGETIAGCWILRMPATATFWQQLMHYGLPRRMLAVLAVFSLIYALEILGWRVIGQGALAGRLDLGWFALWALLVISLIPLQLLGHWLEGTFSLDIGRILKQRLLAGAMKMNLESIRQQGAGQLLGRVIESQALESLALNGGLSVLIAGVELMFASWVVLIGAGGGLQLSLLLGWLGITIVFGWRYFRCLRRATLTRLEMTHDLVERMVGHRTCLAQESSIRREAQQDYAVDTYLNLSRAMDNAAVPLASLSRGWLVVGLLSLVPSFVSGSASAIELAVGLGGTLLASRAFSGISGGFSSLARAVIAWEQVAPFFYAASQKRVDTPFLIPASTPTQPVDSDKPSPVLIDASDLMFRYQPQGQAVLRGVDLTIRSGERILLTGSSGGGKSTLAALFSGLRVPESGLLLLNGLDKHTLGEAWHSIATSAPQFHENHIFTGTLAFNLLMGRQWPCSSRDLRDAEALCLELGLGDLLQRMPSGLHQMVGETGWQLSHGERSRVFLARALLQDAQLTILDESFAALDPETLKRCLHCALQRAKTLLVIAHP